MGRCWAFAEVDCETRFDVFGEGIRERYGRTLVRKTFMVAVFYFSIPYFLFRVVWILDL
jgi:hypothetical protein